MLHAHTRQYQKLKSNFKRNLKSKCQSKSVTRTKQLTYDQTKETNRIKDKKIEIIEKIADFFCQIQQCVNGCDFFGCFNAIIRCDIFPKKTWYAMQFSIRCDAIAMPACQPVYCSDMRCSAMLVERFDASCFALWKKNNLIFGLSTTKEKKNKKKNVFYISSFNTK